jgi:nucleoside-diphosphate-sugar epimerase
MTQITVLGASGFIGSHLVKRLKERGLEYYSPDRKEELPRRNLGHVIYSIGLTADFRTKPFDTVQAHVCKLLEVLRRCEFDSLLYLSSTRVYQGRSDSAREESLITIDTLSSGHLYNLSKLMGESLSLNCGKTVRVVRLANVYGGDFASENFLSSLIRDAVQRKKVRLCTSLDSAKDYVSIDDVVDVLIRIATEGRERIYNVASGQNVSNRELVERIGWLTSSEIEVAQDASVSVLPRIGIDRLVQEFGFKPAQVLDDLEKLVELYKTQGATYAVTKLSNPNSSQP